MEKYGTIPPRFTKDWWAHYWTYYKLHLFFALFIIFSVSHIIHSCVTQVDYDVKVQYAAYNIQPSAETLTRFDNYISSICKDVTGNKKIENTTDINIIPSADTSNYSSEYEYAIFTKFIAQIETCENQIYIVDKSFAEKLISYECLASVNEWADDFSDDLVYENKLISLSQNSKLKDFGFDTQNLYIGILNIIESEKDNLEYAEKFENAKNIANKLIKE